MHARLTKFGAAAAFAASVLLSSAASASVTVHVDQVGSNVVATTSGSINLNGLTFACECGASAYIWGAEGFLHLGADPWSYVYEASTGASNPFGSGIADYASGSTGDHFGIASVAGETVVAVPIGYISGSAIADSATWLNQSFASLGLTPGIYTFKLPKDSAVVNIGNMGAVPEPATWAMMLFGLGAIGLAMRRRGKQRHDSISATRLN